MSSSTMTDTNKVTKNNVDTNMTTTLSSSSTTTTTKVMKNNQTTTNEFRNVQRHSNFRANILLFESICLFVIYCYYLYSFHYPSSSSSSTTATMTMTMMMTKIQLHMLAMFCFVYLTRLNIMARIFLKRELAIEEITVVPLIWLSSILSSFVWYTNANSTNTNDTNDTSSTTAAMIVQLIVSLSFYIFGSYLNTYSEYQRMVWKRNVQNKGRCYMDGLFSYSRNINYFGDTILFAGWAVATGIGNNATTTTTTNGWSLLLLLLWNNTTNNINLWVPIVMGLSFWFHHIPDKEKYLQQRYSNEWSTYVAQTPYAFIPFIC